MRRLAIAFVLVACGAPARTPPSQTEWTARCSARVEAARTKIGLGGATKIDPTPWNPGVSFEVKIGAGYYQAFVHHGRGACIDFDSDDPKFINLQWTNGAYASKVAVDRIRRVERDEAVIQADKVPPATVEHFRAAFEDALEACLQDARGVKLEPVSKDISCIDKSDKCPDSPETNESDVDGCPDK
jgi:hypothetical protein